MKIYDKEIYQKEQIIKSVLLIIGVFVIGFMIGYFFHGMEKQNEINTLEKNIYVLEQRINTL